MGLGLANLAGSMFNCYTTTGSFSRSAVNNLSGAKSQLSGLTTGLFIMVVLLVLTPVFTNCPQSVQGAVVIAGVSSLFNYKEWWFLWKVLPPGPSSRALPTSAVLRNALRFVSCVTDGVAFIFVCQGRCRFHFRVSGAV